MRKVAKVLSLEVGDKYSRIILYIFKYLELTAPNRYYVVGWPNKLPTQRPSKIQDPPVTPMAVIPQLHPVSARVHKANIPHPTRGFQGNDSDLQFFKHPAKTQS